MKFRSEFNLPKLSTIGTPSEADEVFVAIDSNSKMTIKDSLGNEKTLADNNDLNGKEDTITNLPVSKGGTGINSLAGQANKVLAVNSSSNGYAFVNQAGGGTVATIATAYSVMSAKTNASGYADFVKTVSNTEISFDTDSGSTPITICYPDGTIETNNTLPNIDSISTDGTYYVVKEKGDNPYITTLIPIESYVAPSSPSTNQLWLNTSITPNIPNKWNGSAWITTQFAKLGTFTRASGIIGTHTHYPLNNTYISSTQTYTRLSTGMIYQSGEYTPSASKVLFYLPFPNNVIQVLISFHNSEFNAAFGTSHISTKNWDKNGFNHQVSENGVGGTRAYFAIGY